MKAIRILLFISIIVFIYSSFNIVSYFYEGYKNNKMNKELDNLFYKQEFGRIPDSNKTPKDEATENNNRENNNSMLERFLPLLEINPEIVGWINIPGTVIDYPVVQTDNNEYYLSHDIDGNKSRRGTIFMDYRNTPDGNDKNTILYGHNMRDGSMFKDLTKFKKRDFFQQNTTILLYTLYEVTEWEIFSAYVTGTDFNYIRNDFRTDEDFLNFINTLKDKSMYKREVELTAADKIITLSTCSYEFNDARFVVHARRVR